MLAEFMLLIRTFIFFNRTLFIYDFSQLNQWSRLNDTNGGHVHGASTIYKGKIFVAGLWAANCGIRN